MDVDDLKQDLLFIAAWVHNQSPANCNEVDRAQNALTKMLHLLDSILQHSTAYAENDAALDAQLASFHTFALKAAHAELEDADIETMVHDATHAQLAVAEMRADRARNAILLTWHQVRTAILASKLSEMEHSRESENHHALANGQS